MRRYIADTDDGHDYDVVRYESGHRAGTRGNLEDARAAARRKYGRAAHRWAVVSVMLADDQWEQRGPAHDVRADW